MSDESVEIWAWYVLGSLLILTRFAVRIRTVGFKGFQGDDYVTIATLLFYTLDAATVTTIHRTGQNVDLTEADLPGLTRADYDRLTYGSKLELTAWFSYSTLIWCMKFTMLFFYKRLTLGSLHNKMVRYLFWVCGVAYIAVFLTLVFGCYPFQMNWQISPLAPWRCRFRLQNFIVVAALNISTDMALLAIPIPMLWKLKLPIQRKIVIALILSSGAFVITAAIIRVVYSLNAVPSASNINRWGVRETIIGIVAVNIPILRPLFSRAFWTWGAYDPTSTPPKGSSWSHPWKPSRLHDMASSKYDLELGSSASKSAPSSPGLRDDGDSRKSSQEHIFTGPGNSDGKHERFNVFVHTTYDVSSQERDDKESTKDGIHRGWLGLGRFK